MGMLFDQKVLHSVHLILDPEGQGTFLVLWRFKDISWTLLMVYKVQISSKFFRNLKILLRLVGHFSIQVPQVLFGQKIESFKIEILGKLIWTLKIRIVLWWILSIVLIIVQKTVNRDLL